MLPRRTRIHKSYTYIHLPISNPSSLITTHSTSKSKSINFTVFCNTQITKHARTGNIQEAESVFHRMPTKNVVSHTAMLTAYADNGWIDRARVVFDKMPERSVASWNAMITGYIRNGGVEEARELFRVMPERNAVSYATMITGFVRAGDMERAEGLFKETPVIWRDPVCSNVLVTGYLRRGDLDEAIRAFEGMVKKNVVSWSSMVDGYCKYERIKEARDLFDKMPERNVVSWTVMVNGYFNSGNFEDGFRLFLEMRMEVDVEVNSTTLAIILEACGNFRRNKEGYQIHGLVLCMGFDFDIVLGNSLISMYCRFGMVQLASKVFHSMTRKDIVSWNSLIAGYVQSRDVEVAYSLFQIMPVKDKFSWTTMITGLFGKGLIENAVELFNIMPNKDDIAWTSVITGFVNNEEYEKAITWFIKMLGTSIRPNSLTLSGVLSASAGSASSHQGLLIHGHVVKMLLELDLSVQNSLVSMYSKCGHVKDALRVFQSVIAPNVISFNSMITGYAQNGFGKEAINLFEKMQKDCYEPNDITFLGVLSACTHMGLVEQGWSYFDSMRSLYNIEPTVDHYACMVDLLGKAGLLDEAMNLINSMPFEPHAGVWGALLGASRTYIHLDIAKLAAQRLLQLEPNNAVPYVVLSDIYTIMGEGEDGERVRFSKKSKNGMKKSPGCSWIMVKDKVNLFSAGDRSSVC